MLKKLAKSLGIIVGMLGFGGLIVGLTSPVLAATTSPEPTSIIVKYKNTRTVQRLPLPQGVFLQDYLSYYQSDPAVAYAEPNYIYQAAAITPTDIHYSDQWYLKRIKAPEAWSVSSESPNITVAIIDSGVYIQHPDLRANIWTNAREIEGNKKDDDGNGLIDDYHGWDFVNNVSDPGPKFMTGYTEAGVLHGTIIAGIIGASGNNIEGVSGVSWKTNIMSLKVLDDAGNGETSRVVQAIDYAVMHGAHIINLSFVGYAYSETLKEAIERAVAAGVLVVAPAGNEQSGGHGVNLNTKPIYPACYKNNKNQPLVIGVAATDAIDQKASFSGYGNSCVSLSAPGVSFYSTSVYAPTKAWQGRFFDTYYGGYWSGTSVAVPLVSGTLALIQAANPTLSPAEARDILLTSTDNIDALNPDYYGQLGRGRLNMVKALQQAKAPLLTKSTFIALTPAQGSEPFIDITDMFGEPIGRFLAYPRSFKGGVNLATADFNQDGYDELITVPASQREADVKIFNHQGEFQSHFLAYPYSFQGGVNVATGDLNNDGKYEIITAPASGASAEIKVFTAEGKLIRSFLAYPRSFTGGAVVAVGNVMGGPEPEIIVGTGKGGVPQVKIFSSQGVLLSDFVVGSKDFATGLRLSLLDIDENPRRQEAEILITRQSKSTEGLITDFRGTIRRRFQVYNQSFPGDVRTVTADINRDGVKEIISFPGAGGGPHVKFFNHLGDFQRSFYAYPIDFSNGVTLTVFTTY